MTVDLISDKFILSLNHANIIISLFNQKYNQNCSIEQTKIKCNFNRSAT